MMSWKYQIWCNYIKCGITGWVNFKPKNHLNIQLYSISFMFTIT